MHADLEEATKTGLKQTLAKAVQALAKKQALPVESIAQFKDACLAGAKLFGWDGKPSVTYYGDDNRTVVVCDEARRRELIEQRQRLLEAGSQGKVIEVNGHEAKAAVPVALPASETQPAANVGAGNATVAGNQRPTAKQDPLSQWMDSVGKAETWKHAGQFGPYPEEQEKW